MIRWTAPNEPIAFSRLRRLLLVTFMAGAAGTGTELLLLGHIESWQQWIPVSLLGASLLVCLGHILLPGPASLAAVRLTMVLFVASGAAGVVLHYQGNVEFELEMYPHMRGLELFAETMTGATPVLAPGTMVLLGLVGLAYAYSRTHLTTASHAQEGRE